ncbi:MAG: hypothetical protein PHZ19_09845 [Candidatus Thermoplasmatota archaeon]|nr:hypothetical protein [Candidatus Thermoplasmatota archaeon]
MLSEECSSDVCAESIEALRHIVEDVAREICTVSVQEFEELNALRRMQGLREYKRLNVYVVKRGAQKVLNPPAVLDMGLHSENVSPGGIEWTTLPPKHAREIQ